MTTAPSPTSMPRTAAAQPAPMVLQALFGLSLCHLLNDAVQALLPAIYPLVKGPMGLSFTQIGMIGLVFQLTASVFQPLVGIVFDRYPKRWPLPGAMLGLSAGLIVLASASSYVALLLAAFLIGTGSAVFHPEASRGSRLMSGGRFGFAQSLFQTGGNIGSACGPLLAAFLIVPYGQRAAFMCLALTLVAFLVLTALSGRLLQAQLGHRQRLKESTAPQSARKDAGRILAILVTLICVKNIYTASMQNYYSFHLIDRFGLSVSHAQILLFAFLGAVAVGTLVGGLLTDRIGTRRMINFSIIGALPFALVLPHLGLAGTVVASICVGLILASAFSAIVVYGQELMPGRVGMISGLFFGLAFGFSGAGAAGLGALADLIGLQMVMVLCGLLPVAGLLSLMLPDLRAKG